MSQTVVTRRISAPPSLVFETVSNIRNFSAAVPHITNVEMLTERETGVGTRFRETRRMGKREHQVELEVTEYVPSERVRLVSDSGGTIWDTVFTVQPDGDETELRMVMDAQPHKLLARLFNPLFSGSISKAVESDMDAVKAYCEMSAPS